MREDTKRFRCNYIADDGRQCEIWTTYRKDEDKEFCPLHEGIIIVKKANGIALVDENKQRYIDRINTQKTFCANMSIDELDNHIASMEKAMEELRTDMTAARASRADKFALLTEEEQKTRRAIKIVREMREVKKTVPAKREPWAFLASQIMKSSENLGKPISEEEAVRRAKETLGL